MGDLHEVAFVHGFAAIAKARGYSRRAFEKNNSAAEKHGATSARCVQPLAERIAAELHTAAPWCAQPAFGAAVAAWSYSEAQAALVCSWIDENGILDDEGKHLPACAFPDRVEARAGRLRDHLGLTPRAWAQLVASLGSADHEAAARGLAELRAVGAELARTASLPESAA